MILGVTGLLSTGGADAPTSVVASPVRQEPDRRDFMLQKLKIVNRVVEGIATDDFELVSKSSFALARLTESAAWLSNRDPFYRHYSQHFEHAIDGLARAADARSPEKVTFAYTHLMISCTACHQHVRNVARLSD